VAQQVEILSLSIDTQALLTKLSETKKSIEQLQASQKELQQAGEGTSQQFIQQSATLKNLQQTYNKQLNVVQQLEAADKNAANAVDAVNTALKSEIKSIDQATENNKQLRIVRNQLNLATEEGRTALDAINKKIDQNTTFIKENVSALEQQKMNIGNYSDSIKEALGNLNPFNGGITGFVARSKEAGGAGNLLKDSFSQLSTGIGGATKSALAFIATPIGAAIAGIAAAFAAGKAIFDYNKGLQEANKELKSLGVNASELSNVRSEITATAETFNKDFKDIASKANSLAKSYGISMSEANNIIAEGLAKGGAQNEEFLDSLGEYDQLFANAGYSAQQFVDIVNQGYKLGIYADKLPDAIKEADLALKEQGKATRDALVNAFGASFTDEILKKVRTGEATTAQALDAIAKKSGEVQLTQQQQAQLTADVFKGAGEDAGGAMAVLTAINQSANKEIDATAKKQLELQEATERLNKAQAGLFEIKDFGDVWTTIKTVSIEALASMMEYIADVKKDIQPLIDFVGIVFANAWTSLKTTVGIAFDFISANLRIISNAVSTFFNFFKAIVNGDFTGAINALKDGFYNLLSIVGNTFGKLKNTIINGIQGILDNIKPLLNFLKVDVDALNKSLDKMKSKNVEVKAKTVNSATDTKTTSNKIVADVDPNAAANAKASADAAKAAADTAKKITDERAKATVAALKQQKEEIDFFVASQGIKKKSLYDELDFEKQILNKKLALNEAERKAGTKSETAYQTEKLNLTNAYAKKQADVAVQIATDELDVKKKALERQKQDDTFFTEEKLSGVFKLNNDMALAERDYQLARKDAGVISEQEYLAAVDQINEDNRIKNEQAQKLREDAKKQQKALDLENQRIIDEDNAANDFEFQLAQEDQRYQVELKAAEKEGLDTTKITQKHTINKKKIEDAYMNAKIAAYGDMFGQIAGLLGENTQAGKAAAIANATINTYEGITNVWQAKSILPEPFGTVAKIASTATVLASGLGAVKKITSVATPKYADGGQIPTLRSGVINSGSNVRTLSNGDDTLAYVRQGEVILNEEQQRRAGGSIFFRNLGVPGFAGGGQVGGNTNLGSMGGVKIDVAQLAQAIGQEVGKANLSLPAPRVEIDTITEAQTSSNRIKAGASL